MPNRTVDRSTVNKEQYAAPEFQKSGFAPNYSRHTSFILGRMHISGVHWTMPADKIYGSNNGDLTFNRIVTPMLTPCDAGQYNFYLPLRAIDNTFEQGMTPTELNAMSANWHTPKCNTKDLVSKLLSALSFPLVDFNALLEQFLTLPDRNSKTIAQVISSLGDERVPNLSVFLYGPNGVVSSALNSLTTTTGSLYQMADKMYLSDALLDIADNITAKLGSSENPLSDSLPASQVLYTILDCILTPWVGRYSYLGELRFNYLRPYDLFRIVNGIGFTPSPSSFSFVNLLDDTPLCEYPLRVMYAIWYERFRDIHLEPVSASLPYWRNFGSTSIFDLDAGGNLCYLIYRIRPWYKDPFTTAQIDNISRHVYAPVSSVAQPNAAQHVNNLNLLDTQVNGIPNNIANGSMRLPSAYNLGYRDQLTGSNITITCPVPSNVNDVLSNLDKTFQSVFGLDLNTLRQSQMLERYLKRNYLFGDEYQDRMLAHYNSRVSDMRINKPELLSSSLNQSNMVQQVSNVSTEETKVGERTATSTVQFGGDEYGTFCEEFGIVINLLTIMPHAIYDGVDAHLYLDQQQDFPLPEFASNNEEFGRKSEIASSGLAANLLGDDSNRNYMFGRYPAYHIWRGRVDEVGGMFLDELQDCTYRRFWGNYSKETTPKLNYWFLHCRPNLGMFANTNLYDCQLYGTVEHQFYVERVLPTPVEVI